MSAVPKDFYEIQKSQRAKSLTLFAVMIFFYFAALGIIALALVLSFGLLLARVTLAAPHFWVRFLLFDLAAATLIAVLHFLDARRNGPRYILKRLQAAIPDPADRYHQQFLNTLDGIRIAAGLPRVNGYVLPTFAINSLALIEADGTPAVAVTEGLLSDGTRDELEAVAAHEVAHIARGDAFYLTLVCSLANIFEKLREALEPEREDFAGAGTERRGSGAGPGTPPFLFYIAVYLSALVMHLLSMLISRERELLADAAAVELCRAPDSLARAIYKAQVKNSFIGDFSLTYTPLFIVPPDAGDVPDNLAGRMFNSHPPLMKRLGLLAAMARKTTAEIIDEVRQSLRARERARGVVHSFEEIRKGQTELIPGDAGTAALAEAGPAAGPGTESMALCPRCRIPLAETFYEGVPIRACRRCTGKLVDTAGVERIIARREVMFSDDLAARARAFEEDVLRNPGKRRKINVAVTEKVPCPACGYRMVPRPYNYQYFVPVDKCLSCSKIWFDADELEILQALVETHSRTGREP
jgi:Zn-dependent protease with chaperone function/Zn-finger nucleic acid-binding protein